MPSVIDQRLASSFHLVQIERILRCEGIADDCERLIRKSFSELIQAAKHPAADFSGVFPALLHQVNVLLADRFQRMAVYAHDSTVDVYARSIPRAWLRLVNPVTILAGEDVIDLGPGFAEIDPALANPQEPSVSTRMTDSEWADFLKKNIFEPPPPAKVEQIIMRPVAGFTWDQRVTALSRLVQDPQAVANNLRDGYATGETIDQLQRRVQPLADNWASSARRIARTEGLRIANQIQHESYEQLGGLMAGLQIVATLDERTRPAHRLWNGRIYWSDGRRRPPVSEFPDLPAGPNCVLPGQHVTGEIFAASKAFYSGKAIEITTHYGSVLRVTPNHPVLTKSGFVPARSLRKGDDLVSNRLDVPPPTLMADNVQHEHARIEDVFRSLAQAGIAAAAKPKPLDFHGDACSFQNNIEIVAPKWVLRIAGDSPGLKLLNDGPFGIGIVDATNVAGITPGLFPRFRINSAAPAVPSPGTLSLNRSPISLEARPLDRLSFGLIAHHCSILHQQPSQPPRLALAASNAPTSDANLFGQLVDGFSGVISCDQISDVREFEYSGHVYDLQTVQGWYFASGILLHNCRCMSTPVLKPPKEFENDPAVRADFQTATGDTVPDPSAYSDWFRQADVGRRKMAVGARRYQTVQNLLGGTEPAWADFIDPDGKLLSVTQLRGETQRGRDSRVAKVSATIATRMDLLGQVSRFGFVYNKAPPANPAKGR